MKIAVTGARGLIGTPLVRALEADGHTILRLVRPDSKGTGVRWDPDDGTIDLPSLERIDAAIHLAAETTLGVWTQAKRRRIHDSRANGTRLLATSLAKLTHPPSVLISASGINYYGNRPDNQPADESAPRGAGFLADVVEAWERATDPARDAGIRVVNTRFGMVLSPAGGALGTMLPIFRLGIGGSLGNGRHVWSWVAIDDVVGAVRFALTNPALDGPVNVVAPQPVTNLAFTRTLGRVLRRPTFFVAPAFLLKAVADQMADEMLLYSVRVMPRKLREAGYVFQYPELEKTLQHLMLSRS